MGLCSWALIVRLAVTAGMSMFRDRSKYYYWQLFCVANVMRAEVNIFRPSLRRMFQRRESVFPLFLLPICLSDFQPHLELTESGLIPDRLGMPLQEFLKRSRTIAGREPRPIITPRGREVPFSGAASRKAKWLCRIHALNRIAACSGQPGRRKNAAGTKSLLGIIR